MNHEEAWLIFFVFYQLGFLFTNLGLLIIIPPKELSGIGVKGWLAHFFRMIVWPYGLYYYTLRDSKT